MPLLPIECDTDGIYFQWNPDYSVAKLETDLDVYVKDRVRAWAVPKARREEWGLENTDIEMEMDTTMYDVGWFYMQKTYVLLTECNVCNGTGAVETEAEDITCISCEGTGEALKIKGGSFKSQRNCIMIDKIRDELARLRMHDAPRSDIMKVIKKGMAIEKWSIDDLVIRLKLTKAIDKYAKSYWGVKIARRAERELGVVPTAHYQYEFIYASKNADNTDNEDGIAMKDEATAKMVDYYKYREMVAGIAERFGWLEMAAPLVDIPPLTEDDEVSGW